MSYSVNFYLDRSISSKRYKEVIGTKDKKLINYIDSIKEKNTLQMFVYLRFSGRTVKAYVERKCTQKQWNPQKQRVNPRYFKSGATPLNNYLNSLSHDINELHENNLSKSIPTTKGHIKALIDHANNRVIGFKNQTFLSAFDDFISASEITKQKSTITIYRTLLKHLKAFAEKKRFNIQFETIDMVFEDKFREYLIKDVNLTNNTIAKNFKTLKTFLNFCTDRNYNDKLDFMKFDAREHEKEVYALTKEELMRIYKFVFQEERLSKARDLFCFSCFTGLRFSDIEQLNYENIKKEFIDITIQKTGNRSMVPLNQYSKTILDRYLKYESPLPRLSSQKINKYLKEIGQLAGIDEKVRIVKFRGAKRIESIVSKHEVLTFHVARKTFITLSLVLGMNERAVKEISGHKKDSTFQKYVKFADDYLITESNDKWNNLN